ncbi:hypothetical protein HMPREF1544_04095 [Mucor circinelloides 1006PhL]|uniref:Uncharacterized protein n=1 Tax=Mucor circinelloides f. circinelloides (strain 1006PhL) TaxID=1220926 RepID=S2K1Q4_MUCC1|nr:hypothetical protein HMPREF1544_04095 [Mucor circinelloides 1006PhL]
MFKAPTATLNSHFSWLPTAGQLSPAYDYFDFINTFDGNQRSLNRWYGNIAATASDNEAVSNSSADEDSDSVRASSSSANHRLQYSKEKVTEDLENYSFDEYAC